MPAFTLSVLARSDLKDIARHTLRRWGREQRNLYLKQLDDAFHALAETPALGVACDHVTSGCRKFPLGSHMIYYRHGSAECEPAEGVAVLRILHKSMDAEPNLAVSG